MKYLGCDIALNDDGDIKIVNGDIGIVEDRDCLAANLFDRIMSGKNEILMHCDFGAGLPDMVSMPMSSEKKDSLAIAVKHEILKDTRVGEVTKIEIIEEGRVVYIQTKINAVDGQVIGNLVFPFGMEAL